MLRLCCFYLFLFLFFFFNDTAPTEIYTLSLHDALPILEHVRDPGVVHRHRERIGRARAGELARSEEHTSELQSHVNLVCRLLLEKKKRQQCRTSSMASNSHICANKHKENISVRDYVRQE